MSCMALRVVCLLAIAAASAACAGHQPRAVGARRQIAATSRSAPPARGCPVTLPRPWTPPAGVSQGALFGSDYAHGNGKLWVGGLWPAGVIEAGPGFVNQDGSVGTKFGWWRNVRGHLQITGQRMDLMAPPLRASVPAGYGVTGFQASGVIFPTEGCWRVTAKAGPATLTFVTFVHVVL